VNINTGQTLLSISLFKAFPLSEVIFRSLGSMTSLYKVNADRAEVCVDSMGVDWVAQNALLPIAHVPSTSSAMSLKRGNPFM
jgi:hypothetical protein